MNLIALQLNATSDKLEAKLPPTDSRLRPDMRALENGDMDKAQVHNQNMVAYQRKRRLQLQTEFKRLGKQSDMYEERDWYSP